MAIALDKPGHRVCGLIWTRVLAFIGIFLLIERSISWYTWNTSGSHTFSAISELLPSDWLATEYTDNAIEDDSWVRKSIIVASVSKEHTEWIGKNFPDWEVNNYIVDDITANYTVLHNQGREANVYLTYIINHYYSLPDYMVFIHAQRTQWHNDDPMFDSVGPLRNLQLDAVDDQGYVSLRCDHRPGCPVGVRPQTKGGDDWNTWDHEYARAWKMFFPKEKVPKVVSAPCCAQFAVSRAAVQSRPIVDYERYRQYLWNPKLNAGKSGRVFEYLWHVIFGKPPIFCPPAQDCYCKSFGLCDLKCPNAPVSCLGRYAWNPYLSFRPLAGKGKNGRPVEGWWEKFYPPSEYDGFHLRRNATTSSVQTSSTTSSSITSSASSVADGKMLAKASSNAKI